MSKFNKVLEEIATNEHESNLLVEADRAEILQKLKETRAGAAKDKAEGMVKVLSISPPNAKIDHHSLSLPAGYSCCGAKDCLSYAGRGKDKDGKRKKLKDGPDTKFRCFAASQEQTYTNVSKSRWTNFDLIKATLKEFGVDACAELIDTSINNTKAAVDDVFRIHVSGDFFDMNYFDAWIKVAKKNPNRVYYAYTKSVNLWVQRLDQIPDNFQLNASLGGKYDDLAIEYDLKTAKVVFSVEQAQEEGLEIDYNDDLAWSQDESFAILLHGVQPKGSEASAALQALRKSGLGGKGKGAGASGK